MKILKIKDVIKKVALSETTIYRKRKEGSFPKAVRLGPRTVGWIESEIDEWISEKMLDRVA